MKTYTVPPTTRYTIDVKSVVPELQDEAFGARIEVTNGVTISVERSMYWDANGVFWSRGTNAHRHEVAVGRLLRSDGAPSRSRRHALSGVEDVESAAKITATHPARRALPFRGSRRAVGPADDSPDLAHEAFLIRERPLEALFSTSLATSTTPRDGDEIDASVRPVLNSCERQRRWSPRAEHRRYRHRTLVY